MKAVGVIIVIAIIAVAGHFIYKKHDLINKEIQAVELFNKQQYSQAAELFISLVDKHSDEADIKRINNLIAKCYKNLAENPSIPMTKSKEFLKKVSQYDSSVLTELDKKLISK